MFDALFSSAKDYVAWIGLLWAILAPAALWWLSKSFATRTDHETTAKQITDYLAAHDRQHDELESRLALGEREFTQIKADLKHMPTRSDIQALDRRINEVLSVIAVQSEKISSIAGTLNGVKENVALLMEHHLKSSGGGGQ